MLLPGKELYGGSDTQDSCTLNIPIEHRDDRSGSLLSDI